MPLPKRHTHSPLSRYLESLSKLESLPTYSASSFTYRSFLGCDPIAALRLISNETVGILYFFFEWILSRTLGKDGRKLRGTKKRSSLGTYWKVFRLVFERATGDKLDAKLNRKMHRVPISQSLFTKAPCDPSETGGQARLEQREAGEEMYDDR